MQKDFNSFTQEEKKIFKADNLDTIAQVNNLH